MVLEDVAGLDGLHQAQVAGVDDGGGQTLHHRHGHQSGVHDGTNSLGRTVGVVGQTAGGLQALVGEHLDGVQNVHLLVLHALDNQEQGVEPQIVGGHAQAHAALQHVVAVLHALFVVLGNAVGRAEGDTDGVVGSSQIDVGNTGTGVGGVDDGLAVGTVVDLDTGFNSPLVGGVQSQRNVVEVLLQQLDSPHHALGTVLLSRSDVDVQIGSAGSDLLGSTLQDGLGIPLVHSLADGRRDAVDTLADGDEGLALGVVTLVLHAHVHDLDLGNLGSQQLVEGQLLDFHLSGSLGGVLGGGSLGGGLVFLVLHVLGQLNRFGGADNDIPAGQLLLDLALHNGNLAGDDQGAVLDLVLDVQSLEGLLDGGGGELTGSPGSQNGHAGSVGDDQVHRLVGTLQFAGNQEVGQREVHGHSAGAVLVGAVQRIDLALHLHGLLRIGEDVLTQTVQRQRLSIGHVLHDDDGGVLLGEHGSVGGLQMVIAAGDTADVDDGGIAEAAVAILDGGTAHQNSVGQSLLGGLAGDVQHQVLVAGGFQLLHGVVQVGEVVGVNAQNNTRLLGDSVHSLVVFGGSAVQDDVLARDCQSSLGALHIPALQNQVTAGSSGLLDQFRVDGGIGLLVGDENELNVHSLADTLVVNLLQLGQLLVGVLSGHAGADGNCVQVLVDQGLLVTIEDSLAAQLVVADGDGLHGRRSLLVEHRLCVVREVRALVDGDSALRHLHTECHAGGAAALLTVLLRRQLKNVKTFQSHCMYPPSDYTRSVMNFLMVATAAG